MSITNKIFDIKSTVKYHIFNRFFLFYKFRLKLFFIHFFTKKQIQIIILTEHIGDIIAFTPFAESLKKESKNNFVVWITNENYKSILTNNLNIDLIFGTNCDGIVEKIKKQDSFKTYDVRFNGNNYCVYCKTEKVFNKIDNNFTLHNYYEYGSLLEIFSKIAGKPLKKEDWKPKIILSKDNINKIESLGLAPKYIVIHTVSNDLDREWQKEKWLELIKYIHQKYNILVIEIGLKQNFDLNNKLFLSLCGKLNLKETAALIKSSFIYMGIDSGPAHMANAMGTKSIILLGKYRDTENYMPFSGNFANGINSKIIYNKTIKCKDIETKEVSTALDSLIENNE